MKLIIKYLLIVSGIVFLNGCSTKKEKQVHHLKFSKQTDSLLAVKESQGIVIDSLREELKNAEFDTAAIDLLNELAYYWKGAPIKIFCDDAYRLSENKNYTYGKIDAISKNGYYLYWTYFDDSALVEYNHALELAQINKFYKLQAKIHGYIGDIYRIRYQYENALSYYDKSIKLSTKINDKKQIAFVESVKGDIYRLQSEFKKALFHYKKSLETALEIRDFQRQAFCYAYIGDILRLQGNFVKSLSYYNLGLKFANKCQDKNQMAFCYSMIGDLYTILSERDRSLANYFKALKIAREINDLSRVCSVLQCIGNIYIAKGKSGNAIKYYEELLVIARKINEKSLLVTGLIGVGEYYRMLDKFSNSHPYYKEAIKIAKEINYRNGLMKLHLIYSYVSYDYKKYGDAIKYADSTMVIAKEINQYYQIIEAGKIKEMAYEKSNDYKNAFLINAYCRKLSDSLVNQEQIKKFAATEYKSIEEGLRAKHKQKEALNKIEQEKKEEEINHQRFVRNGFIGGFAVIAAFSILLIRSLRENKKQRKIIQLQKEEVEEKQKEVMDSIRYARRIQRALLPSQKYIERVFKKLN